jgi:hypothetical protein
VIAPLPVLAGVCKHARPSCSGNPLLCVLGLLCRGLLLRSVPGRIFVVRVQRGPTEILQGPTMMAWKYPTAAVDVLSSRTAAFTTSERGSLASGWQTICPQAEHMKQPHTSRPAAPVPAPAAGFKQAAAGQPAMVPGWIDSGQANHGSAMPHFRNLDDDVSASACHCRE